MMNRARLAMGFALLCVMSLACERPDGPRRAPYPVFDPSQPFPELEGVEQSEGGQGEQSFEDAINDALEGEGVPGGDDAALTESGSYQKIPLASLFVAEVPLLFDEWQYVTDGGSTLLVHRKPGAQPDAIIYVEAFSPAVEQFPSYEVARFQFTVDPGLSPNSIYPPLGALVVAGDEQGDSPAFDAVMALQLATTRTLGRGLGYRSTSGSFTGWKWVGRTEQNTDVRLGRSSGRWGEQGLPIGAILERILADYAGKVPEIAALSEKLQSLGQSNQARNPGPAWMVIGSIARQNNPVMGVHVAMICAQRPVCPVARELAHMLGSVKVLDDAGELAAPASQDYKRFASDVGIELLDVREVISAPEMMQLIQQAQQVERGQ